MEDCKGRNLYELLVALHQPGCCVAEGVGHIPCFLKVTVSVMNFVIAF